ncbi:MAG: hypothetical protein KF813_14410 [Trueperaceae bacterium]|nr:hypothetical protein [Trueperaceae bacterium]
MTRSRKLTLAALALVLVLGACVPLNVPGLRNLHNQTWAARFEVEVRPAGLATIRLPVDLALTFSQNFQDVTARATLQYDTGIFRLETGGIVDLSGRIGFDDRLDLSSSSNALQFDGRFVGDRLIGTVSIGGLVPVADVVFTRTR